MRIEELFSSTVTESSLKKESNDKFLVMNDFLFSHKIFQVRKKKQKKKKTILWLVKAKVHSLWNVKSFLKFLVCLMDI